MSSTAPERPGVAPSLRDIQAPVRDGLSQVGAELLRILLHDAPLLGEVNHHLLGMKGKMFRPTLVLLSASIAGDPPGDDATTVAALVELVHLATLVHDDAVDHSVLRRGMPTINSLFSHQVSVLAGDYLYSRALLEAARLADLDVIRILAHASNVMSIAEMRQLAIPTPLAFTEEDYFVLIRGKTAVLIEAACEVGALRGSPAYRTELARYGDRLGMAFQIVDDLLDYTASEAALGKPIGSDLREHKVTLPLIASLPRLNAAARARVETLFAAPEPADDMIADVVGIVTEHGGLEDARRGAERFAEEAAEALSGLPESAARSSLTEAIAYVLERQA